VDIVAVSVNVPQHYDLIRPALEAGKDVFSEWPLARNLAEADELVQLAKEKGVRTSVGLQARQNPSILKAKEIVASGKLGKILNTTLYGHVSASRQSMAEIFKLTHTVYPGRYPGSYCQRGLPIWLASRSRCQPRHYSFRAYHRCVLLCFRRDQGYLCNAHQPSA
jgi:hypothetical protein